MTKFPCHWCGKHETTYSSHVSIRGNLYCSVDCARAEDSKPKPSVPARQSNEDFYRDTYNLYLWRL